jgi:hypothetical protein
MIESQHCTCLCHKFLGVSHVAACCDLSYELQPESATEAEMKIIMENIIEEAELRKRRYLALRDKER